MTTRSPFHSVSARLCATLVVAVALANAPAWAAGDSDDTPAASTQNVQYATAKRAIEKGRFATAIPILEKVIKAEPRNAGAHNYLAFSHRKLGRLDVAYDLYKKTLAIDPKHRGAHEYGGGRYLRRVDLAAAEKMLEKLDSLCFFGCEEYTDLKKAIAAYKAGKKPGSGS
jgi:Flp pilus assembly protein TadD